MIRLTLSNVSFLPPRPGWEGGAGQCRLCEWGGIWQGDRKKQYDFEMSKPISKLKSVHFRVHAIAWKVRRPEVCGGNERTCIMVSSPPTSQPASLPAGWLASWQTVCHDTFPIISTTHLCPAGFSSNCMDLEMH